MSDDDKYCFQGATHCWLCEKPLDGDAVRDHDHLNRKYRGPAHSKCNLQAKRQKTIPIFFHNFSGYDCHLMIKHLMNANTCQKIKVIGKTYEEYISLQYGCIHFIDSLGLLQSSLDAITKGMKDEDFKITK